jgi:hypothetical protein
MLDDLPDYFDDFEYSVYGRNDSSAPSSPGNYNASPLSTFEPRNAKASPSRMPNPDASCFRCLSVNDPGPIGQSHREASVTTRRSSLPREEATVMNDVIHGQKRLLSPVCDMPTLSEWYRFKLDLTLSDGYPDIRD